MIYCEALIESSYIAKIFDHWILNYCDMIS